MTMKEYSNSKTTQDTKNPPTIDELILACPRRGTGAGSRSASRYAAILRLFANQATDGKGILGSELYSHRELYGRSPRNRISELRRRGHLIEGKPQGGSDWFYWRIRDAQGRPSANRLIDSHGWYERQTGKPRTQMDSSGLPLFAGAKP